MKCKDKVKMNESIYNLSFIKERISNNSRENRMISLSRMKKQRVKYGYLDM